LEDKKLNKLISVVEGKSKRYVVICNAGLDNDTGKRKQIQKTFNTLEEAEEFVRLLESELRQVYQEVFKKGKEALVGITFLDFVNEWFYGQYRHLVKPITFRTRRMYFDGQVVPFFGDNILSEITVEDIRLFYHHLEEKGYAQSTITHIHGLLSTLFHAGLKSGIIKENPTDYIRLKRNQIEHEPIIWSNEERIRFLKTAEQENKDMIYRFSLSTGTRLLEILAVTWANIDFDKKKVTITKQLSSFGDRSLEKVEILRSGFHELPLPSKLIDQLLIYKTQQDENKKNLGYKYQHELDLVFPNRYGGYQNPSTVRVRLNKLIVKANVPLINFHGFRRMYAFYLAQSGLSIIMIQKLLRLQSLESTFHLIGRYLPLKDAEVLGRIVDEEINKVTDIKEKNLKVNKKD
jgi:integrase